MGTHIRQVEIMSDKSSTIVALKFSELKSLDVPQLKEKLEAATKQLWEVRSSSGHNRTIHKAKVAKKNVAAVKRAIAEFVREAANAEYKDLPIMKMPKKMSPVRTRKERTNLNTIRDKPRTTLRTIRKRSKCPKFRFYIKA